MILEVRIPNELRAYFLDVRILKGLRDGGRQQGSSDTN
jgi:hypothetical protein